MLTYICIKLFFGKVVIKNQDKIPSKGPLIFVANHRNMILDAGVIKYSCKRNLFYLAKHTIFENRILGYLFRNANSIPVYRRQDDPNLVKKNIESFNETYDIFKRGESLMIFPEGISFAARTLFKIKTGAARIALNAELKNNFNLDLKIVPVGINYSDPSRFKSDVFVQYGDPISIKEYKKIYEDDSKEAVVDITHKIEESLLSLTTNLSFIDLEDTINYLELIYKNELLFRGLDEKDKEKDFHITKDMISAVEWYLENNSNLREDYVSMVSKYIRYLEKLKLDDRIVISGDKGYPKLLPEKPVKLVWFIGLFPIYLYGFINNFLGYKISIGLLDKQKIDEVEIAQYKFFIGLAVFSVFYLFQTGFVYYLTESINLSILYLLLLIPSGNFALLYHNEIVFYLRQFRFFRIFIKRSDVVYKLTRQRKKIIDFISDAMESHSNVKAQHEK